MHGPGIHILVSNTYLPAPSMEATRENWDGGGWVVWVRARKAGIRAARGVMG